MKVKQIVNHLGLKYSSVMSIVNYFRSEGRINKLLTPNAKNLILYFRQVNLSIQRQYREHKRRNSSFQMSKKLSRQTEYRWVSRDASIPQIPNQADSKSQELEVKATYHES